MSVLPIRVPKAQAGPLQRFGHDDPRACQCLRDVWPSATVAHELGVERRERVQRAATQGPHPVEALHFEKPLRAMVDDTGERCGDARVSQHLQRDVFRQQEVAPTFAHQARQRGGELDDGVHGRPRFRLHIGSEFRLFTRCGRPLPFAARCRCRKLHVGLGSPGRWDGQRSWRIDELLACRRTQKKVARQVVSLKQQGAQRMGVSPVVQPFR